MEVLYQYQMDLNGNPVYINPEYYLYSLSDGSIDNAGIYKSYITQRKAEDILIKDKYAKYANAKPAQIGGMKWKSGGSQFPVPTNAMKMSNAAPRSFSFGNLSKVN